MGNAHSGLIKSESKFTFSFDGDSEIDAALLSRSIANIAELVKIAAANECPDDYVKINVVSLRSGSFQIGFSTVSEAAQHLLRTAQDASTLALTLVGVVLGIFKLKKHLKGQKPKSVTEESGGMIVVENPNGQKITVCAGSKVVLADFRADQLVVQLAENAQEHHPNGGFTISTEKERAKFQQRDMEALAAILSVDESRVETYVTEAEMPIRKPDLLRNAAWQLVHQGRFINAKIMCKKFLEDMKSGKINLKPGSYIRGRLETTFYLDKDDSPMDGGVKYAVTEVHELGCHETPEQMAIEHPAPR